LHLDWQLKVIAVAEIFSWIPHPDAVYNKVSAVTEAAARGETGNT